MTQYLVSGPGYPPEVVGPLVLLYLFLVLLVAVGTWKIFR